MADGNSVIAGVTVDISKPGQLMGELTSLAQTDPDKFKTVTTQIAQQLKDAASSQSDSAAGVLNKIADRFGAASQSGNASDLTPDLNQAHAHHHSHGGDHRAQGLGSTGQAGATGAGSSDSVRQTVQDIISSALGSSPPSA